MEENNMSVQIASDLDSVEEGRSTPEQVLKSIVDGINTGNLDALMRLYEPHATFAAQPGRLAHGLAASVNRWSSREIAQMLGLTEGNVRVIRCRAIDRLRVCLGAAGPA
jgi:hypothetical protein